MRPVTDVVVRSPAGVHYVCSRVRAGGRPDGPCELGRVADLGPGGRCSTCRAEIVATRRGLGAAHLAALAALIMALGWLILHLWH